MPKTEEQNERADVALTRRQRAIVRAALTLWHYVVTLGRAPTDGELTSLLAEASGKDRELFERGAVSREAVGVMSQRAWAAIEARLIESDDFQKLRVKEWLVPGELEGTEKTPADIIDTCCDLLDAANTAEILGTVLFLGNDGRVYTVTTEAAIGLANPVFACDQIETLIEDEAADLADHKKNGAKAAAAQSRRRVARLQRLVDSLR